MTKQFKPKTTGVVIDEDNTSVEDVKDVAIKQEENPVETVENSIKEEVSDVVFNPDIDQKPVVKNVKVRTNADHNCCIGGVRYYFKKGVQTDVPCEVKSVLLKSGLLMPL